MRKILIDYGPLAVFLLAYRLDGLQTATLALMIAAVAALGLSYVTTRKVAVTPLLTAVIIGIFGGLTLWFKDDSFIKMKPTVLYAVFSLLLLFGLATGRPVLKLVMGEALPLDELGWRRLSLRFLAFFIAMAIANEAARRLLTTDQWVLWKVPGSILLTIGFMLTQIPLIQRHMVPAEPSAKDDKHV